MSHTHKADPKQRPTKTNTSLVTNVVNMTQIYVTWPNQADYESQVGL